jgi:hypothetical protein
MKNLLHFTLKTMMVMVMGIGLVSFAPGSLMAQYSFPTIAGPQVVTPTPVSIPLDVSGVPAGSYISFTVSVAWANGFDAWSSESRLRIVSGATELYPISVATSGAATNDNATTLTWVGSFTYNGGDPLSLEASTTWGGSSATWSNIAVTISTSPPPPTYCASTGTAANTHITNVTASGITTLNNSTGNNGGYADFTAVTPTVSQAEGQPVSISVTATSDPGRSVFIDWNNDGIFQIPAERVYTIGYTTGATSGNFNVPVGQAPGNYRMRVVVNWLSTQPVACNSGINGETEDYTFVVVAGDDCDATPTPGNTESTSVAVCDGANFTLSLENTTTDGGISYQWQTSPDGSAWTNAGPDAATWETSQSADTYYRCEVTCDGEGTGTSTALLVELNTSPCCTPSPMCAAQSTNLDEDEYIVEVDFAGLNHPSGDSGGYGDYRCVSGANVTPGDSYPISVWVTNVGTTGWTEAVSVFFDWDHNGIFEGSERYDITPLLVPAGGTVEFTTTVNVPMGAVVGMTEMRVVNNWNAPMPDPNGCGNISYGEVEDYLVEVMAPVACDATPTPGNTESTAAMVCADDLFTLSLENETTGGGVSYQWQTSPDGSAWTNDGPNAATWETSQTSDTYYRCEVTCDGEGTGTSTALLVEMETIAANCICIPTWDDDPFIDNGCQEGDVIARVILNTLDNESGTTCPSGALGYSDYTDYSSNPEWTTDLQAGTTYTIEVFAGAWNQDVAVWIDYNDNGVFEASERVGFSTTPVPANGSNTFPISLACDPPEGEHLMRIRSVYEFTLASGADIDPCATHGFWGETEDYIVNILAPPACPTPSGLVASNETPSSVDLNWNEGCNETAWEVEYGAPGFTPGDGTTVPAGTNSGFELGGLDDETSYDVYVRANCDVDGLSSNFGPVSFTTLALPPSNDLCGDAISVSCGSVTAGTTVNASNTGAPPNSCGTAGAVNTSGGVWYTVTGIDGQMFATTCSPTFDFDTKMAVYTGSCGSFVCVDGDDDSPCPASSGLLSAVNWVGSSSETYYIYVTGFGTNEGIFDLTVDCVPFPANNECGDAQNLSVAQYPTTNNALGTLYGATNDGGTACTWNANGGDVYYTFTAPTANHYWVNVNPFGGADVAIEVTDACGGTVVGCEDTGLGGGAESAFLENLPAGTYTVRVYSGNTAATSAAGNFMINVQSFPTAQLQDNPANWLYACNTTDRQLEDVVGASPQSGQLGGILDYQWQLFPQGQGAGSAITWTRGAPNYATILSWLGLEYGVTYNAYVRLLMNIPGQGPTWGVFQVASGFEADPSQPGASICTIAMSNDVSLTQLHPNYVNSNIQGNPYAVCNNAVALTVNSAENYEWEFDNGVDLPVYYVRGAGNPGVKLSWVDCLKPNSVYAVRVRANVDGQWGAFGTPLNIEMGPVASTGVRSSQCGATIAPNKFILPENVCRADGFVYELTNTGLGAGLGGEVHLINSIGAAGAGFLNTAVPALVPGGEYSVRVKAIQCGEEGDYSSACNITVQGPQAQGDETPQLREFAENSATLYPNPNAGTEVRVELDGLGDGNHEVMIQIYDVYGKLIQTEGFGHAGSVMSRLVRFDGNMAMGMYMVQIVVDGERFATERLVIK